MQRTEHGQNRVNLIPIMMKLVVIGGSMALRECYNEYLLIYLAVFQISICYHHSQESKLYACENLIPPSERVKRDDKINILCMGWALNEQIKKLIERSNQTHKNSSDHI
ncbi:MAG: hypothetical protein WAM14_23410 [Candidatus Nitrosopolaris sp.]